MNRLLDRYMNEAAIGIIGGVLTLLLAALIAFVAGRLVHRYFGSDPNVDRSVTPLLVRTVRTSIMIIALLVVLDDLGIEITTVLAALGIFGFAIGLALRPSLANIFTGVALFTVKPYRTGDHVESEKIEGVVEHLGIFHTELTTRDGVYVSVPNDFIWAKSLRNHSRPRPWRTDIAITMPRLVSAEKVRELIMEVVAANPDVSHELPPSWRLTKLTEKTATSRLSISCPAEKSWDVPITVAKDVKEALLATGLKPVTTKVLPREAAPVKGAKPAAKAAPKAVAGTATAAAAGDAASTPAGATTGDKAALAEETSTESGDHREKGSVFGRGSRPGD